MPSMALLSQAVPSSETDWTSLLAVFGPFAPFAIGAVVIIAVLWRNGLKKDEQLRKVQELATDKLVPALTESNRLLANDIEHMARATEILQQVTSRPELSPETWRRVLTALENVETGRNDR